MVTHQGGPQTPGGRIRALGFVDVDAQRPGAALMSTIKARGYKA
jgi:hypothetical protein